MAVRLRRDPATRVVNSMTTNDTQPNAECVSVLLGPFASEPHEALSLR
jgi:hypothetical protein